MAQRPERVAVPERVRRLFAVFETSLGALGTVPERAPVEEAVLLVDRVQGVGDVHATRAGPDELDAPAVHLASTG